MPEERDAEECWRALANEARAVADEMMDPDTRRIMLNIATAYDRLARNAKARKERTKKSD